MSEPYTDKEKKLLKEYICPDCFSDLEIRGDKLVCDECGFFCPKERANGS